MHINHCNPCVIRQDGEGRKMRQSSLLHLSPLLFTFLQHAGSFVRSRQPESPEVMENRNPSSAARGTGRASRTARDRQAFRLRPSRNRPRLADRGKEARRYCGNLLWQRGVTLLGPDAWGSLMRMDYSDDTPAVLLVYDALGRRTSVMDAAGTTTYTYDDFGDIATEIWGGLGSRVLTRHRDAYGRDAGYSVNGSRRTTLGYDSATGRLATMNADGDFAWQYLAGSDLKSRLTYPNGLAVDYAYDPNRDLLTGVRNSRGETVYSEYLYENDALGRRTAKNDEQYGYNVRSELVSAATNGENEYAYAYDDIGNRQSSFELGTNNLYTANALNQYLAISNAVDEAFVPVYDADGNQALVKTSTGVWQVTYNGENRPVRWTRGNTVVTMDFDSMGRRTFYRKMEGNRQITFTRFFYDGYLLIQELSSGAP